MNRIPSIECLHALGASSEAIRWLCAFGAYFILGVVLAAIVYGIFRCTADIWADRLALRDRALDRIRGGRA